MFSHFTYKLSVFYPSVVEKSYTRIKFVYIQRTSEHRLTAFGKLLSSIILVLETVRLLRIV